jgi:hypothetical protein
MVEQKHARASMLHHEVVQRRLDIGFEGKLEHEGVGASLARVDFFQMLEEHLFCLGNKRLRVSTWKTFDATCTLAGPVEKDGYNGEVYLVKSGIFACV